VDFTGFQLKRDIIICYNPRELFANVEHFNNIFHLFHSLLKIKGKSLVVRGQTLEILRKTWLYAKLLFFLKAMLMLMLIGAEGTRSSKMHSHYLRAV
jgi:hypothetical protein